MKLQALSGVNLCHLELTETQKLLISGDEGIQR